MKESYDERLAPPIGPESCGAAREGGDEALKGERTGRVLSCEIHALPRERQVLRNADAVETGGRQYWLYRHREVQPDSAQSETPSMYGNTLFGNREVPRPSAEQRAADRIGKSKDVRR